MVGRTLWVAGLVLLLCTQQLSASAVTGTLRGVDPALAERYTSKGSSFKCFDGSKSMPHKRINDNYCDCIDGSDEPGSSACWNGRFYCRNRGYEPKVVNSSMVDDGICDCCDGTDEQPGKCMDTCLEAGAAARAELKARTAAAVAGARVRDGYIKRAKIARAEWDAHLKRVDMKHAEQKKKADAAKAKKEAVEAAEKQEREVREAREKVEREEREKAQKEAEAAKQLEESKLSKVEPQDSDSVTSVASSGADQAGAVDTQNLADEVAAASKAANEVAQQQQQEQAAGQAQELDPDEEAKQRLAQWVHSSDEPPVEGAGEGAEEATTAGGDESAAPEAQDDDVEYVGEEDGEEILIHPNEPAPSWWSKGKAWVLSKLQRAPSSSPPEDAETAARTAIKAAFTKEQNKLTELEREKQELERKLGLDLGPEGAFMPLIDRCIEANVDKYTYSVCPFKDAHQKDGGAQTKLGGWSGWESNGSVMSFTNGQGCWNGPARSITVTVVCGQDEALMNVLEPNRCEYIATMTTPAACTPAVLSALQGDITRGEQDVLDHTEL
ncbi:hypothetical protein WJX73_004059 [Symbiochloris irregularis]|uniref:Glucosidase 2 subunit beta n=1 Tax=Symbiochloris irregularis TaxID=706552 RepID=A0AAW1NM54_9CHLO